MDNGYGITATGFNKKTFNDLLQGLENRLKSQDLFGENIDFSDQDPLKQFSVPILEIAAEIWELGEQVFYSASPKYAEGVQLKNTGKYIGISSKQVAKSKTLARFFGGSGTLIPTDFKIKTQSNVFFRTIESKLIPSNGYIDINIEALEAGGNGNVPASTINTIVTPIIGLNSVTNLNESKGGQDEETDLEFRNRYDQSTSAGDGSTVEAIKAKVLAVTGVTSALVTENEEDTTVNNLPPHSIEALVKGGDDLAIAQAIFSKKPGGTKAAGTTIVNVVDSQGIVHQIGFSRPTNINVWLKITLTTDATFPADGKNQIKKAILTYIDNIKQGESVIIYKISSLISNLKLNGLTDIAISLSTDDANYTNTNITVSNRQVAVTTLDKIGVM